jgi:hypothetical protein
MSRLAQDRTRTLWIVVAAAAAAGIVADLLIGTYTTGLMMAIGFLGCGALILGAKATQKRFLKRPEGYYDELARRTGFAPEPLDDIAEPGPVGDEGAAP